MPCDGDLPALSGCTVSRVQAVRFSGGLKNHKLNDRYPGGFGLFRSCRPCFFVSYHKVWYDMDHIVHREIASSCDISCDVSCRDARALKPAAVWRRSATAATDFCCRVPVIFLFRAQL